MVGEKTIQEEVIKELEQDLRELESYIQDFWRFLPVPICYVNPVHNILDVDQSLARFSGYSSTDLIGSDLGILFNDPLIKKFKEKIIKEGFIISWQMAFITKDKKEMPVEVSGMARKNEEGEVIGYFISIIDVSESVNFQKKLQEEVDKKTKELQEKIEELETFHKIAVGRELKMIELKEENQKLKEELEKYKG
jgi:PAS domain S-box-containing protein